MNRVSKHKIYRAIDKMPSKELERLARGLDQLATVLFDIDEDVARSILDCASWAWARAARENEELAIKAKEIT